MDIDTATPQAPSYTILRIKRKRNEEPLDALVIESRVRRKKSRGGIGVFQYAQTVEKDAWQDEQRQKDIQEQISRLARETALKAEWKETVPPPPTEALAPTTRQREEIARRYTIVEHEEAEPTRKFPKAPPKVVSEKELRAKASTVDFKMYDAIPQEKPSKAPEVSSEMDKFLPMLNDYLKIHDITPSPSIAAATSSTITPDSKEPDAASMVVSPAPTISSTGDDYVWDVFYHRPATLSEWNEAANVGTLTGLPPSFGDGYDSVSDSEEEDEADEDSNAEEYYKNDYPDGDSSDSDEFHEESDYDDMMHYKNEEE
ncbi:hypothetical protein BDQ12DRAFT_679898 [Crucibulum laeve]|uniref:Probable RNA polymerase II nuclear localization protein SLC7A6OS n=1 Tax=Crucibulum laeve TaxID=68775 RepID=A0A5C3M5W4_9AGAR|nr:hypothetical protein BDQ12DRAFT_679898 [Crucibulum laeve]